MVEEPLASLNLPFDLASLLSFTLADPFAQTLANSSCNDFFESYTTEDGSGRIRVSLKEQRGGWGALPLEWREYFHTFKEPAARSDLLEQLTSLEISTPTTCDFPPSLQTFLNSCRSHSFDRTCSLDPILSYPPNHRSQPSLSKAAPLHTQVSKTPALEGLKGKAKAHHLNALKAGQSPKKQHEVVKFCALVESMLQEERCSYCVDVGSGRAHLSRALASPPLDLHVLALDWSSSQKSGAEKLDQIRTKAELNPTIGSLTHRVNSLDEPGVRKVLEEWPPSSTNDEDVPAGKRSPALLVALHACGDLTPDSIKAFTDFSRKSTNLDSLPRAVFVGCCYNLQTPSLFPLSKSIESLLGNPQDLALPNPNEPISLAQLRLTPQSPPTWHLDASSTRAFLSATSKLAYRSRLEAELEWNGFGIEIGERKVGRIPDCKDWEEYRGKAIERMRIKEGDQRSSSGLSEPCRFGEEEDEGKSWEEGLFFLRVWWTIRSWLGPPLESLVVLDRYLLLVEGLYRKEKEKGDSIESRERRRRVDMVNIFDQATGSLRNIALVVR
ncbi:hypothetical protein JCM16303_000905 [Sporobolomyces ruberrimus]